MKPIRRAVAPLPARQRDERAGQNASPRRSGLPLIDRLWAKTDRRGPDECWEWGGHRNEKGYGRMDVAGRLIRCHRVSWEIHNGPIPVGKQVLHRCDNPPCWNPAHLFLGTNNDNIADRMRKGRTPCGEKHKSSKLTAERVREILKADGSQRELARRFGISRRHVGHIRRREVWKHIEVGQN